MTLAMLARAWEIPLLDPREKLLALAIADQADDGPWHGSLRNLVIKTSMQECCVLEVLESPTFQLSMSAIGVYPITTYAD